MQVRTHHHDVDQRTTVHPRCSGSGSGTELPSAHQVRLNLTDTSGGREAGLLLEAPSGQWSQRQQAAQPDRRFRGEQVKKRGGINNK